MIFFAGILNRYNFPVCVLYVSASSLLGVCSVVMMKVQCPNFQPNFLKPSGASPATREQVPLPGSAHDWVMSSEQVLHEYLWRDT